MMFMDITLRCALRAIENGANFLAEGFLFAVAAALILGETWRSSRSSSKRRDDVDEKLEDLQLKMQDVTKWMEGAEERYVEEQRKYVSSCPPDCTLPLDPIWLSVFP